MEKVSGFLLPICLSLVILVYTTLGILSYSTARADFSFAQRNLEFNQEYYQAEGRFEQALSELDQFANSYTGEFGPAFEQYLSQANQFKILEKKQGAYHILFEEPVTENVMYKGELLIFDNKEKQVISRGVTNTEQWEEQFLEVWSGE